MEGESVVIEAGAPCHGCGEAIDKQEDKPVVFFCEECNTDHVWHEDCLPPGLAQVLKEMRMRDNARWN